jgi:hypothetical protein
MSADTTAARGHVRSQEWASKKKGEKNETKAKSEEEGGRGRYRLQDPR